MSDHNAPESTERISELLSNVFEGWLEKERIVSTTDRNRDLDDLEAVRRGINNPLNAFNVKAHSHGSHILMLVRDLEKAEAPEHIEAFAATLSFRGLMAVSGAARKLRYLQSTDQHDYYWRKEMPLNEATGVDTREVIQSWLDDNAQSVGGAVTLTDPSYEAFAENARRTIEVSARYDHQMIDGAKKGQFGAVESFAVTAGRLEHAEWLRYSAHSVMYSASLMGDDLSRVPLREPKSISDGPAIIYPFSRAG
jgi:hypothetical protein